ncbi:MAG: hypothetical protein U9Q07_02795 [Planctomycetota bacterium]|nr:hypothetical protein [Planctomycetota bacterium]
MTDNERIAEWRGWTLVEWDEVPGRMQWRDADDVLVCHEMAFLPDTDITLWHGPDGLLAEIDKRRIAMPFLLALTSRRPMRKPIYAQLAEWLLTTWETLTATPAQLTAALVAVIKEVPDGVPKNPECE